MSRFRPPVRSVHGGYEIDLGPDEVALIRRLVGELRVMLTDGDDADQHHHLLSRLFPVAHADDDEMEAEYQRLMRDELVQSKLAAFDTLDAALDTADPVDEMRMVAVMQSINSIRLVLGTLLGLDDDRDDDPDDDPDDKEVAPALEDSPEYQLYGYLSWLLEWCVRALSAA
ncbi:MAG: DUF2017 family protein [Ilumatobacteraceae bacterium]